jgi:hypothetical protein
VWGKRGKYSARGQHQAGEDDTQFVQRHVGYAERKRKVRKVRSCRNEVRCLETKMPSLTVFRSRVIFIT